MGFLDGLFGKSDEVEKPNSFWNYLEETTLDEIIEISKLKPVIIFKHSTTCGISKFVWSKFQKEYKISNEDIDFYYLDLLSYRSISNEVAERFNIVHQSPQLLVIKDGVCVFNKSHESIDASDLNEFI
jgi:bacillithiol system protein YtxJ